MIEYTATRFSKQSVVPHSLPANRPSLHGRSISSDRTSARPTNEPVSKQAVNNLLCAHRTVLARQQRNQERRQTKLTAYDCAIDHSC